MKRIFFIISRSVVGRLASVGFEKLTQTQYIDNIHFWLNYNRYFLQLRVYGCARCFKFAWSPLINGTKNTSLLIGKIIGNNVYFIYILFTQLCNNSWDYSIYILQYNKYTAATFSKAAQNVVDCIWYDNAWIPCYKISTRLYLYYLKSRQLYIYLY